MIIPIQPSGPKPPLFAVHILGGMSSYYKAMSAELGPDQPVIGVAFRTLSRDKPIGVENAARTYFEDIQTFHPEGKVHLAAVSLAAYFAWELAWLLTEAGREVGHLALFDANGPDGRPSYKGLGRLRANLRTIHHRGYGSIPIAIRDRYRERQYLRDAAKMKAQTQKGEKIEIRRGQDFIAANEFAVANYTPKPLPVPVTIYRSNENFFDTEESIRRGLGWDRVALAGYEVIDVPGGHLTMLDEPHVKTLAGHIAHGMAKS